MIANSSAGVFDRLEVVPNDEGVILAEELVPTSILSLTVAGNELLPSGVKNDWNSNKSKFILNFYGDNAASESDTDNTERAPRARNRRLRVAKCLGVTRT